MEQQSDSENLQESLISLNDTLNKDDGIVNTSSAHRFLNQPEDIEAEYEEYARTHALQDGISTFIENLTGSLNDEEMQKSVPGYIVGPYGFGKTSTAGKVWYTLENEHDYIATPPIYFDELQSIVDATYGWMRYKLRDRPEFLEELDRVYEAKASNNIEEIIQQTGIEDKDALKEEMESLIQSGSIDIEFSVTHVLEFLSECNQIAKEAGYNGLVVIADELQQFVSSHSSDQQAYSDLRDLAKSIALGLNDGDGLGLLFTMDDGQHSDLDVNADDVLARLREQNAKLNLSDVYNRSFPDDLWKSLSQTFGFVEHRYDIITEDTLDAMGQICERGPPLSNGPRTVVDLLTIAIDHYISKGEVFDALDLADAYYTGKVRFKGDQIKQAISEGINAEIVDDEDREDFIKLCGVYPRGISEELIERYGVFEAKEAVKSDLHGQLIITHEEGRTLKRLSRDNEDRGIRDELFTQFYRDYDTTDTYHENALRVFRNLVLTEEIFPSKRGKTMSSWVTTHEFEPETGDAYTAIFRGSFNGQTYPQRIVEIRTGPSREAVKSAEDSYDVDLVIGFVCNVDKESEVEPHIERIDTDEVIFYLDFTEEFESLPNNIALLESYMSPEDVNPHLLMALNDYMRTWQEDRTINPNQEEQLEYIRDQLINRSVQKLFGDPLNGDPFISGNEASRRSIQPEKVVPEVFLNLIEDVYPEYTTLFISDNYTHFLEDYESLLLGNDPDLRISQKRGNTPIEGTKGEISNALGVSSNSTANSRLDKQYNTLIDKQVWDGQDARIQLKTHPLEDLIKAKLEDQDDEQISIEQAYEIADQSGYREEEVDWAIRLLVARDYIVRNQEADTIELSDIAIDYDEVAEKHKSLEQRAQNIAEHSNSWDQHEEIQDKLVTISEELNNSSREDIEILDGLLRRLQDIQTKCDGQVNSLHATYLERAKNKKEDIQSLQSSSRPSTLNKTAEGCSVPFAMHLEDKQTELDSRFQDIELRAQEAEDALRSVINEHESSVTVESVEALKSGIAVAEDRENRIEEDIEEIVEEAADYASWCQLAAEMGDTRSEMIKYRNSHDNTDRVEALIEELDSKLQSIQTKFQSQSESILRDSGVFEEEFRDLAGDFDDIIDGDQDDFLFRKNVLQNTLDQGIEGHPSIRQNLNPNNAQQSRSDLKHEFERKLQEDSGGIEDIESAIEKVESDLGYAELLNHVPDNPGIKPNEIRSELQDLRDELDDLSQSVSQIDLKDQIDLPNDNERSEMFPNTDWALRLEVGGSKVEIGSAIGEIRSRTNELDDVVSNWRKQNERPADHLKYIEDELSFRAQTDIEEVVTSIAEEQEDVDLDQFFADMQELFEGNHVEISLESKHR